MLCGCKAGGFGGEALGTAVRAEEEPTVFEAVRCGCVGPLDLHAAHRVDGVACPTSQTITVAIQPVEYHKDH